jgi:4-hydroxybenzoate polyprenyltransferase
LLPALLQSLRIHQWSKNILLVVPALLAQVMFTPDVAGRLLVAFVAFGCAASGNYLVNDLTDRESDRQHPAKRERPIAAGRLTAGQAATAGALLIAVGLGLASVALPRKFTLLLLAYLLLALAYSKIFRRVLVLDVMVLAGLYTLRLLAGGAAVDLAVSSWLLAFSMFFFVCLALAKRLAEIDAAGGDETGSSRAYRLRDRDAFAAMGPAAGMVAILVLALYVSSEPIRAHYTHPDLLWLLCPLLMYWVLRVWFLALRGELHHDPVVFALRDPASYAVIAGVVGVVLLAAR